MQMRLSYDNIAEYLRGLYFAIYGYVIAMINENRQDIQSEQERIGIKVAEMTWHDVKSSLLPYPAATTTTTTNTLLSAPETSSSSISSPRPINHVKPSLYNYNDGNFNYMEKFGSYFSNHHDTSHQSNRKFSPTPNYGNELEVMAQSFNDFSPSTRSMDTLKFDKNNFLPNSINATEYDANKSFPFDSAKFETKQSENYYVPAADSSLSLSPSSSSVTTTTTSANTFDLPETDKNGKFSQALPVLENNLNIEQSHKRDGKPNKFSVMYVGPRQFSTDYQDDVSSSSDDTPTLDLNKNSNADGKGDDDSNIFDFEKIILESFGFNANAVKSSVMGRCMRSYMTQLFRRTFEYFILM